VKTSEAKRAMIPHTARCEKNDYLQRTLQANLRKPNGERCKRWMDMKQSSVLHKRPQLSHAMSTRSSRIVDAVVLPAVSRCLMTGASSYDSSADDCS
jgi:hypothetical protein